MGHNGEERDQSTLKYTLAQDADSLEKNSGRAALHPGRPTNTAHSYGIIQATLNKHIACQGAGRP